MKVTVPEISWHERDPIYCVDFQPGKHLIQRLASGGVDKIVRIWQMKSGPEGKEQFEILSNLRRHTAAVNVVRFSPNGDLLSTAGDDSSIVVWKLSDVPTPTNNIFSEEGSEEDKETWVCHKTLRGHLGDVADISWSKDNRYLVSGSVDNSAIVWDVAKAQKVAFFNDHKSYVQGVAFDPLGDYIATLCSDRSLRIFNLSSKNCIHNVSKMMPISGSDPSAPHETKQKPFKIFHDDSLLSFFRRLEWTIDGQLLLTPAGCVEVGEKTVNSTFVFARGSFTRPALYLPSDKSTTVVRANPQLFELRKPDGYEESGSEKEWVKCKSVFSLPYRIVFAVATENSILLYDTQQTLPVSLMKNVHYSRINDLSWTSDGRTLIASSTDGFCTIVTFETNELGTPFVESAAKKEAAGKPTSVPVKGKPEPKDHTSQHMTNKDEKPPISDNTNSTFSTNKDKQTSKPDTAESKQVESSVKSSNDVDETSNIKDLKIEDAKMEVTDATTGTSKTPKSEKSDAKTEVTDATTGTSKTPESEKSDAKMGVDVKDAVPSKSPAGNSGQKKKRIQFTTLSLQNK